jgi:hypothetical protein
MLEEIVENTHKLLDADLEILNSINKDDLKRYLELVTPPPPTNIDDNTLLSEDVFYYDYC